MGSLRNLFIARECVESRAALARQLQRGDSVFSYRPRRSLVKGDLLQPWIVHAATLYLSRVFVCDSRERDQDAWPFRGRDVARLVRTVFDLILLSSFGLSDSLSSAASPLLQHATAAGPLRRQQLPRFC